MEEGHQKMRNKEKKKKKHSSVEGETESHSLEYLPGSIDAFLLGWAFWEL